MAICEHRTEYKYQVKTLELLNNLHMVLKYKLSARGTQLNEGQSYFTVVNIVTLSRGTGVMGLGAVFYQYLPATVVSFTTHLVRYVCH